MTGRELYVMHAQARPLVSSILWPMVIIVFGALWLRSERAFLPHVDDVVSLVWGQTLAEGAPYPVHALSRSWQSSALFEYQTRLHFHVMSFFLRVFGLTNIEALLAFRAIAFVMAAGIVTVAARHLKLPMVALFFPLFLCLTMLHSGLRPEGTAMPLFLTGFALLWCDGDDPTTLRLIKRTLAKILIILSPLVWPSMLPYGAAVLIVSDLRDVRRRPLGLLAVEDAIALGVGLVAHGTMINFEYVAFVQAYQALSEGYEDLFSFNPGRIANGLTLIALAYGVRTLSPQAAFAGYSVGLGFLIALVLHSKFTISIPMNVLAVTVMADVLTRDSRWRTPVFTLAALACAVLYTNQTIFLLTSKDSPEARSEVQAFAQTARAEKRPLLIDEVAAIHGLQLDVRDAYSWSYSQALPANRPLSVDKIQEGESWIVSFYTVHGWLRSELPTGIPQPKPNAARSVVGLPCLLGRNSCRLPAIRWGYYLIERRNGKIEIRLTPDDPT
jgi:hypothetical protein